MARNSWHHPYRISIVGVYLYAKDLYESKYQLLIKKWESTGLKYFGWFKSFYEIQIKNGKYWLYLMASLPVRLVIKSLIQ